MDGCTDGWMENAGRMDGRKDERIGWAEGRTDKADKLSRYTEAA